MSENAEHTTSNPLTSSAEGSHASRSATPANGKAQPTLDGCGPNSRGLFGRLGPDGFWQKTSQGCFQLMLDGSLEAFCETWPRAGTMRNGTAYRLRPLVPRTSVTGCSFWPTPRVGGIDGNSRKAAKERGRWSTPKPSDGERGGRGDLIAHAKGRPNKHYPTMTGLAHVQGQRAAAGSHRTTFAGSGHRKPEGEWATEPHVGRVVDGVPFGMDRLRGLGNAVVPQVAEWIGRRIMEIERTE